MPFKDVTDIVMNEEAKELEDVYNTVSNTFYKSSNIDSSNNFAQSLRE